MVNCGNFHPHFEPSTLCRVGPSPTMVGRYIPDEAKQIALNMSLRGLPNSDIHKYTGISVRALKRMQQTYRETRELSRKRLAPDRPRALSSMHVKVCLLNVFQIVVPFSLNCSSFVTALCAPLTLLLWNCKLNFVRPVVRRCRYKRSLVPSNGRVSP